MRGVLRSTLLFFIGGNIQVGLLAAAAALLTTNAVLSTTLAAEPHPFSVVLDMMAFMTSAMGLFLAAVNFRAAAAARVLRFIPYARIRLGLGVLLAEIIIAAIAGTYTAISHNPPATSFPTAFIQTLALTNLWILWTFLVAGPNPWIRWGLVGLAALGVFALMLAAPLQVPGALTWLITVESALTLLFGAWYLRARSIGPPSLQDVGPTRLAIFDGPLLTSETRTVINLHLLGQASVLRASWPILVLYGTSIFVIYWMMSRVDLLARHPEVARGALMVMALSLLGTWSSVLPSKISHSARPLWLSGLSREELFAQVERVSLQSLIMTAAPFLTLLVLAWHPLDTEAGRYLFLLTLSTAFCNTYLAIMNVHAGSPLNYPMMAFIIVTLTVLTRVTPTPLIPALEIIALPILRKIALQRWRRIDWMICKSLRRSRVLSA